MVTIQVKKLDEVIDPQDGYIIYVYHDETKIEAELTNDWESVINIVNKFKQKHSPEEIIFFDGFNV
jgi:hypothetical protein